MPPRAPFPSDSELHDELMEQFAIGLECCFVGRVQNYRPESQTCEVVPIVRQRIPQPDGTYEYEEYPVVPSVAFLHPRGRDTFLSFPVQDGDTVLCVVQDADSTAWRRGQNDEVVIPRDLRLHHIAHAVAVCHFPRFNRALRRESVQAAEAPVNETPIQGIVLGYDAPAGTRLLMKPDDSLEVVHGTAPVFRIDPGAPATPPAALAKAAETDAIVSSLKTLIAGWAPTGTGDGASLKALIAGWSPASVATTKVKGT